MKLFLDDFRNPADCLTYMYQRIGPKNPIYDEEWLIVRDYKEFVDAIKTLYKEITHVSFDHDLADEHYDPAMDDETRYSLVASGFKEKTGYDCAMFMKQFYDEHNHVLPEIFVHSMNPVGTKRIKQVFNL
jgi:hypothetical protein